MNELIGTQSNKNYLAMLILGTTSIISPFNNYAKAENTPSQNYSIPFSLVDKVEYSNFNSDFSIVEIISNNQNEAEPLIEMKTVCKIRIKVKPPVPMKFESVEDNDGFIG